MNAPTLIPGAQHDNAIFIGRINIDGIHKGILLPPKAARQYPEPIIYNNGSVDGATSYYDGFANTQDMAKAGSQLAQWALDNRMHIPSQDELEIIYRVCKPTARKNWLYNRSGINLSAVPPTYPYSEDLPCQSESEQFREGGAEAFDTHDWYWSSTRHADDGGYAWAQGFGYGGQNGYTVTSSCLGCAVRWIDL